MSKQDHSGARRVGWIAVVVGGVAVASCAHREPQPAPPPAAPPPSTQVYFYPTKGQTPERQDRDRYECYLWAVKKSGFDPSQPQLPGPQRIHVEPSAPPGRDVAAGAVTGAVIGAVVSPPSRSAEGAVVGAVAGAALGAASEAAHEEEAGRRERQYNAQVDAKRRARLEQQAANYRRAMTACLEGRGYSVR